jgi:hypothetical protein
MTGKLTPLARVGLVAAGVALLQSLLVLWFAWPAERAAPRDLPIVVAGPDSAASVVAARLREQRPGAFRITTVADAAAADATLRNRGAYAAVVLGGAGVGLHVASAASPTVATLLSQAVQALGNGQPVAVVDVVATPTGDPRGAGFSSGFLPLLLTSLACGVALLLIVRSAALRMTGLLAFAIFAGLAAGGVLHRLGLLTGAYLPTVGVIALVTLAISATVCGLGTALGNVGVGLGALVVFFVGNPISGLGSAPELLPKPWGAIGQALPPGAGATLLRSVAFFDGAAAARPLWILGSWAVAGLGFVATGRLRDRAGRSVAPRDDAGAASAPAVAGVG